MSAPGFNSDTMVDEILGLSDADVSGSTQFGKRRRNRKNGRKLRSAPTEDVPTPFDDYREMIDQSISNSGLTFEQRRAVQLIGVFDYTDKQVAAELGRTISTIKRWKKKSSFMKALFACKNWLCRSAMERRKELADQLVDAVHNQIAFSVHRGDLKSLSLEKQIQMLKMLSSESRLDDPTAATSRTQNTDVVEHQVVLSGIQERFNIVQNRQLQRAARAQRFEERQVEDAEYVECSG